MKKRTSGILLMSTVVLLICAGCSPYTKGEAIRADLPEKYALLILDMQNDFLKPDGKLPIDRGQAPKILEAINRLLTYLPGKGIEVVYIGNEFSKSDTVANWFRNKAALQGTEGAELTEDLTLVNNSYFAKNQPDAFSNHAFDQYLRKKKVTKLLIAGVFADQCILSTVKGALQRKYGVYVIADAIGAKTDRDLDKALQKFNSMDVQVVTAEQVIKKIGQ